MERESFKEYSEAAIVEKEELYGWNCASRSFIRGGGGKEE